MGSAGLRPAAKRFGVWFFLKENLMKRFGRATLLSVLVTAGFLVPASFAQDDDDAPRGRRRGLSNPTARQMESARRRMGKAAPLVADMAPVFKLKSIDGKSETDVASFRGVRPIVLFFGSYT